MVGILFVVKVCLEIIGNLIFILKYVELKKNFFKNFWVRIVEIYVGVF